MERMVCNTQIRAPIFRCPQVPSVCFPVVPVPLLASSVLFKILPLPQSLGMLIVFSLHPVNFDTLSRALIVGPVLFYFSLVSISTLSTRAFVFLPTLLVLIIVAQHLWPPFLNWLAAGG